MATIMNNSNAPDTNDTKYKSNNPGGSILEIS